MSSLQKSFCAVLFVSIMLPCEDLLGQESTAFDSLEIITLETIGQLRRDEYESAFANIARVNKLFPEAPNSALLAADAYQTMMRDYRILLYEAQFDSSIERAIWKAKRAIKSDRTAVNYFILGTAQGYLGFHEFYRGNLLKGIRSAIGALGMMKTALRLDREFVDPLFALAIFEYGQYKALGWGLGLFKSKRENALQQLRYVQFHGHYAAINAMYAQQMIYFDGEEYENALVINDSLFQQFFNNPSCLYHRALLLDKTGRYEEAAEIWQRLIECIQAFDKSSNGFLAECFYHSACNAWHRDDRQDALLKIELAQSYFGKLNEAEELQGPHFSYDDLKEQVTNTYSEWQKVTFIEKQTK